MPACRYQPPCLDPDPKTISSLLTAVLEPLLRHRGALTGSSGHLERTDVEKRLRQAWKLAEAHWAGNVGFTDPGHGVERGSMGCG